MTAHALQLPLVQPERQSRLLKLAA